MFSNQHYIDRRRRLTARIGSGLILFLGNSQSPLDSVDNCYPFHQDSSFLYFWGLDQPDLAAVIDVDAGQEILLGDDPSMEAIIWSGPQPSLQEQAELIGVAHTAPLAQLEETVANALDTNRTVHFLPPCRAEVYSRLADLCQVAPTAVAASASQTLIDAVVSLRSIKDDDEIAQIESALAVNRKMHTTVMSMVAPGRLERDVVGAIEGLAYGQTGRRPPFATILSVQGQRLHNHHHGNRMQAGDLLVCDCGAQSPLGYTSDTTRTIPVSGSFSSRQKEIYEVVLAMQDEALATLGPGVPFRDVHLAAARQMVTAFTGMGLIRGDVGQNVTDGVYALFFPHGVGHMLGMDTHDMESLGEDHVGYDQQFQRDGQFGLNRLRLARPLQTGFVVTVEPGIYFIPELIEQWRKTKRFVDRIDYTRLEDYLDFGGIRVEDDVLVTASGARVLDPAIPRSVAEVETYCQR